MIKIEFEKLSPGPFMQVFSKLTRYDGFPFKTTYHLTRVAKKIDQQRKIVDDLRMKLVNEFAMKDEKGEFIPMVEDGKPVPNTFQIAPERQEEWKKKMEDFSKTEAEIDLNPLSPEELLTHGFKMSTQEVMILEPLLQMNLN